MSTKALAQRGFERAPLGKLLAQQVDLSTPMGLAYERAIGFEKEEHVHDRHMLVCPRGACRMKVRGTGEFKIDSTRVLWCPRECLMTTKA